MTDLTVTALIAMGKDVQPGMHDLARRRLLNAYLPPGEREAVYMALAYHAEYDADHDELLCGRFRDEAAGALGAADIARDIAADLSDPARAAE